MNCSCRRGRRGVKEKATRRKEKPTILNQDLLQQELAFKENKMDRGLQREGKRYKLWSTGEVASKKGKKKGKMCGHEGARLQQDLGKRVDIDRATSRDRAGSIRTTNSKTQRENGRRRGRVAHFQLAFLESKYLAQKKQGSHSHSGETRRFPEEPRLD